jgi:hypothetical protein
MEHKTVAKKGERSNYKRVIIRLEPFIRPIVLSHLSREVEYGCQRHLHGFLQSDPNYTSSVGTLITKDDKSGDCIRDSVATL